MTDDETIAKAKEIVDVVVPLLKDQGPEVQGAVIIQLAAMFIAGHHPDLRDEQLKLLAKTIGRVAPIEAKILFGPTGWPFPLDESKAWTN